MVYFFSFFSCLLLCVLSLACGAQETPKQVLVHGEAPLKPFAFVDNQARTTGIFRVIGEALAKEMGLGYRFVIQPWERLQYSISQGEVDVEMSPIYANALEDRLPLYPSIGAMHFDLCFPVGFESQGERPPVVGVPKLSLAFYNGKWQARYALFAYDSFDQAITLLKNRRIDGLMMNRAAFEFLAREYQLNQEDFEVIWSTRLPIYMTVSQNSRFVDDERLRKGVEKVSQSQLLKRALDTCVRLYSEGDACVMP